LSAAAWQLPFAFDLRLNKIPNWHQIVVKFEKANDMKEAGNVRGK